MFTCVNRSKNITPAARAISVSGKLHAMTIIITPDVIVAMNAASQKQDAVWTVLSWMLSEDGQKQQAKLLNVPAIKGIPFDDSDATGDFAKQVLKEQITQLESASGKREFIYPDLKTALSDALQSVAAGQQTPDEAMAAVEAVSQTVKR